MLHFSRLKAGVILCICLIGILLSIPSFTPAGRLPAWYPKSHVNLGLDLQGGSYLLLELDRAALINGRLESFREQGAVALKKAGIVASTKVTGGRVLINLARPDTGARALADTVAEFGTDSAGRPALQLATVSGGLAVSYTDTGQATLLSKAVEQSIAIVRRRIDETGTSESVVAKRGEARILVELPGVTNPGRLRTLLGSTAKMTFHLVANGAEAAGASVRRLPMMDNAGAIVPVLDHVDVDGANLVDATPRPDQQTGGWAVDFALDAVGARQFARISTSHVGERFAIVLDDKVITAPVIRDPIIGGRGQISGGFDAEGAKDLAVLLRAGALPAPLAVIEERSVGASLGADAVHAGIVSIIAGLSLVICFVVALYGRFGVYAAVALIANLALTIAGLALMNATLTLPGIAGLLLALGMAVDANILVNERTREELAKGKSARASIEGGFRRAYTTVLDANLTTLLKMLVLLGLGAGAIRGFAITISLGILVSMFTALVLVRYLTARYLDRVRPKLLTMGTRFHFLPDKTRFAFMRARHAGLIASAVISLASIALAISPGLKMGIDFSGGVAVEARVPGQADLARLRSRADGLGLGPVQVQSFGGPNDVLLRLGSQEGGPKAQAAAVAKIEHMLGQVAPGAEVRKVDVVGATIGNELFSSAIWGLGIAAIAMFAYIAFRFEWPFALGAVATMFLDLTKTIGFFALTGFEFNMTSIAAILTIMGFSINDKVVVYDRVRENMRVMRHRPLREIIDLSINETLSRTIGTSLALFLATAPLAVFGGPALQQFAMTLLFGLFLATSSSIFIAAPLLLALSERRDKWSKRPNTSTMSASTQA
jgi:SecD/SecF fusion protein